MEQYKNLSVHNFPAEEIDSDVSLELENELYDSVPFQYEGLSPEAKDFLSLPTTDRDDCKTQNVLVELDKLEFFHKFSNDTKQALCKKMNYGSFQDMEYLLYQGEDVMSMYIILSGVVSLRYNLLVSYAANGAETQWPERILGSGDYFGHADLLRNRPSSVDAYAVGYGEVLMLHAEDFKLAKLPLKAEQLRLKNVLHSINFLKNFKWSNEELDALEMFSKLDNYLETVEIYSGSDGTRPKWSQFLVSGECTLSRKVPYHAFDLGTSEIRFKAVQAGEMHQKILKKDLQFRTVEKGFFFGVGEDFGRNRVLAHPGSEVLSVMRLVLVFRNWKYLQQMADCLVDSLPSDQVLLDSFLSHETASKEVDDTIKKMLKDKSTSSMDEEPKIKKTAFKIFV